MVTKREDRGEELIDRLRRMHEAHARKDFDVAIEFVAEDFEFHRTGGQSPIIGREAFRRWLEPDAMEEQRFQPIEYTANGNKVLVHTRNRSRGRGSGIELETYGFAVWTAREDGLFARAEAFPDHQREEAERAAGLSPG